MTENMEEKELGYSCHINDFVARAENYPLHKPMVYYDHDQIKDPLEGRSVIRSTETYWKGQIQSDGKGERVGIVGWMLTLFAWQTVQPAMYLQI